MGKQAPGGRHGPPPSIPTFEEELLLAPQTLASPAFSLPLESREGAFEISYLPRTHTQKRKAPQPFKNPEEPDLSGRSRMVLHAGSRFSGLADPIRRTKLIERDPSLVRHFDPTTLRKDAS